MKLETVAYIGPL